MGVFTNVYQEVMFQMDQHKRVISLHYILQASLAALVIALFYVFNSTEWKWAFICLPAILVHQSLWLGSRTLLLTHDKERYYNLTLFILFAAVFFSGYFIIFNQVLDSKYDSGTDCQFMSSVTTDSVTGSTQAEKYSIAAIKFKDEDGQYQYGCACASDKFQTNVLFSEPPPNAYYFKNDEVGAKGSKYKFSEVKMPSWKCSEKLQDIQNEKTCNYRYYNNKNMAKQNMEKAIEANNLISYCQDNKDYIEVLYVNKPGYYSRLLFFLLFTIFYCGLFAWSFNEWLIGISFYIIQFTTKNANNLAQGVKNLHIFNRKKDKKKQQKKKKKVPNSKNKSKKKIKFVCCWGKKSSKSQVQPQVEEKTKIVEKKKKKKKPNQNDILSQKLNKQHLDEQKLQQVEQKHQQKFQQQVKFLEENSPRNQKLKLQEMEMDQVNENQSDKANQNDRLLGNQNHDQGSLGGFKDEIEIQEKQEDKQQQLLETKMAPQELQSSLKMNDQAKKSALNVFLPPIEKRKSRKSKKQIVNGKVQESEYDLDRVPGVLKDAQSHQQAWIVGEEFGIDDENPGQLCECCSRQMQRNPLPRNCKLKDLSFLGSGYPQYFYFIKFSLYLLLTIFVVSGIFNLITNIQGGDCYTIDEIENDEEIDADKACHQNFISIPSLGNKKSDDANLIGQQAVNLVAILGVIIGLHVFRYNQRKVEVECDQNDINASDYTIYVSNIPYEFDAEDYDEEIKRFFEVTVSRIAYKNQIGKKFKVANISLCYDTQKQFSLQKQKAQLMEKKKLQVKHYFQHGEWKGGIEEFKEIDLEIEKIEVLLEKLELSYKEGKDKLVKKMFAGQAFISFRTEQEKEDILSYFGTSNNGMFSFCDRKKRRLLFKGNKLKIEQAQDATNVFWEMLHIRPKSQMIRRILGTILTTIALVFCLGSIVLLKFLQSTFTSDSENPSTKDQLIAQLFAIGVAVAILALNGFLTFSIKYAALREAYFTRTEYDIKVAKSTTIAQFFNTGLLTFIVDVALNSGNSYVLIFKTGGLVYNIFYVFISNAFVAPLVAYFDPPMLIKKLQRYQLEKQIKKGQHHVLTQRQLNELYENPYPDMATQYAILLKTMYFTAFYSVILPIGMVISMLGLLCTYYVDKRNILRNRTIRYTISTQLCVEMTEMIEYVLPIFAASNWVFYSYVTEEFAPVTCVIGLAISVLNAFLPMELINTKLFKIKEADLETKIYEEALFDFDTDYSRQNPATAESSREEFFEKMSKLKKKKMNRNKH